MTSPSKTTRAATNAPTFLAPNVPMLSAIIVLCCADRRDPELQAFWDDAVSFCQSYNLSAGQTAVMCLPAINPVVPPHTAPLPTLDQAKLTAAELAKELTLATPPSTSSQMPKALDPALEAKFPVSVQAYKYFALGQGSAMAEWQSAIEQEFLTNLLTIIW